MAAPVDELTEPQPRDPIPDLVDNILGGNQYISISYWLGWAAEQVTGTNPWQWIAEQYAGDWEAAQGAGQAIKNLGEFNTVFANDINSAAVPVFADWQGHAANSAEGYFSGLTKTIKDQAPGLESIGREFETMAVGMYETTNSIKGLWETLLDLLIAIGLEAAAAAASSWTMIGPVLAGGAAIATITKAMGVWGQILEMHNYAWNAVQGFIGLVAGFLGGLHAMEKHALPASGYHHPGVPV